MSAWLFCSEQHPLTNDRTKNTHQGEKQESISRVSFLQMRLKKTESHNSNYDGEQSVGRSHLHLVRRETDDERKSGTGDVYWHCVQLCADG